MWGDKNHGKGCVCVWGAFVVRKDRGGLLFSGIMK